MYAIVQTGGKQYKVTPHQQIDVDRLDVPEGESLELDQVLLVQDDQGTRVGRPIVDGAKVTATSMGTVQGEKVTVLKYKNKTRYRRKTGHRQEQTRLAITEIVLPGA